MAGLPPFHDGRSMAAAVLGMPQEDEEETMGDTERHWQDLNACHLCGGPLVDGLCARQVAHGSCEARPFKLPQNASDNPTIAWCNTVGKGIHKRRSPPPDLVAEALELARSKVPACAPRIEHLRAIVELLDQRNETIRELLKP